VVAGKALVDINSFGVIRGRKKLMIHQTFIFGHKQEMS
jgi:hypothetical protein